MITIDRPEWVSQERFNGGSEEYLDSNKVMI